MSRFTATCICPGAASCRTHGMTLIRTRALHRCRASAAPIVGVWYQVQRRHLHLLAYRFTNGVCVCWHVLMCVHWRLSPCAAVPHCPCRGCDRPRPCQRLAVLACISTVALAAKGVDVSTLIETSSWECLRKDGYTFASIRAYEQVGRPDSNSPHTIHNAWAGGMEEVDIYRKCSRRRVSPRLWWPLCREHAAAGGGTDHLWRHGQSRPTGPAALPALQRSDFRFC